ncbi:MAG: V-type ATP synthase subunit E [Culturomica sp.]|jgi:V/A-type H+-transporting ATPase subunit E|nr:V-type ATP synthase subunit E [Culturomica sp.]
MDNKLDILAKKLYDEGVNKAKSEAEGIIEKAKQEAQQILKDANEKAKVIDSDAKTEAENTRKKAESEMNLSARQAVAVLKQEITDMLSLKVAKDLAKISFEDKTFIHSLLMKIVEKWDANGGVGDMDILLPEKDKDDFKAFIAEKYQLLLNKGLTLTVGNQKEGFLIQPKDGSYKIMFSEELFESFFRQYLKGMSKGLLYE